MTSFTTLNKFKLLATAHKDQLGQALAHPPPSSPTRLPSPPPLQVTLAPAPVLNSARLTAVPVSLA